MGSMPRKLNSRQKQFAASVAAGKPLVAAYREVYQPANGKAPSTYRNAKRAAKHPGISARIEELELEPCPAAKDPQALYEHGLATIIQVSKSPEERRVQLQAGMWLCAEAEKRAALEASRLEKVRPPERREDVIAELRAIYRRALPDSDPAPLVEEMRAEAGGE